MSSECIGTSRSRAAEILRTFGLTPFRSILSPACFRSAAPGIRAKALVLTPEVVFWLMATVALSDHTMAGAVTSFWAAQRGVFPYLPLVPITEEAFCTARRRLPFQFFRKIFLGLVARSDATFDHRYRWRGFRLLAVDGMGVVLPSSAELRREFPPPANQTGSCGRPQALLVGLVGLWNGVCRDFLLVPIKRGELWCAGYLTRALRSGDLLLADRNFATYEMIARIRLRDAHLLIRLSSNRFTTAPRQPIPFGHGLEWYVDITLPRHLLKRHPHLPKTLRLRILQYQIPGYRPSWLITSLLDPHQYPYEALVSLYHERWRQETAHREWKHTLDIGNLRSLSKQGILKEILVQLTMNNAIRWIMTEAAGPDGRPVELQFLNSKRLILAAVPSMTQAPLERLPAIYRDMLEKIAAQRILLRPGRHYPRRNDAQPRNKGNGVLVPPARLVPRKDSERAAF